MDELITKLLSNALELCNKYNLSQVDIFDLIRDDFAKRSAKLPPKQVLYNYSYGGIGLSTSFCNFLKSKHNIENAYIEEQCSLNREEFVQYIAPYGRYMCERYPGLLVIVANYLHYSTLISRVDSYLYNQKKLQSIQEAREIIESINEFGTVEDIPDTILAWYQGVTKSSLKEYSEKALKVLLQSVARDECEIQDTIALYDVDNRIANIYDTFQRQRSHGKDNTKRILHTDFASSIEQQGFHSGMWQRQTRFNSEHIEFVDYMYRSTDYSTSNNIPDIVSIEPKTLSFDRDVVYIQVGLLCASCTSCNLGIAKIPALLTYKITYNDGKESVIIA